MWQTDPPHAVGGARAPLADSPPGELIIREHKNGPQPKLNKGIAELLTKGIEVTDMNAAIFDPANNFHGCIPGIHEVLRRQGLLEGRWCLNPKEELSPGQMEEIDRVCKSYPHLIDDQFVKELLLAEFLSK